MMVPTNRQLSNSTTIKVMPLIKGLVSATLAFCFISALIFWFVEFRNDKRKQSQPIFNTNPQEQASNIDDKWRRETLRAIIHTRLLMVMWFLILLFLSACYMASLTSLLTEQRQRAPVKNLEELIRKGENVGCQAGSFVFNLLKERGFLESQLHPYNSEQEMIDMLAKGSAPGGVAAVVDETPYLKVFLSKNCNKVYTLVPSINLHADGFGFLFQKNSPLVREISNGILKVMDSGQLARIQEKTIGDLETCEDNSNSSVDSNVLGFDTMWILLAGAIGVTVLVIILYLVYFGTACDAVRRRAAYPCYLVSTQDRKE